MPNYPVIDHETGDHWVIEADTPERAKEIASLRRAAKQGTLKYESPAEEPSLLGFLKESVAGPYEAKPEDLPGFFGSLGRTYSEGIKAAGQALSYPIQGALPEDLRNKLFAKPEATSPLSIVGMIPPVAVSMAAADQAAKTARGFGANPLTAGIISQIVGLGYPSATSKLAGIRAESAAAKAAKEAADISAKQAPLLKGAEQLGKERQAMRAAEEAAGATERAEQAAVETAQKSVGTTLQATKEFSQMTADEARQAIEELKQFPEVSRQVAEAARKRIGNAATTQFQFGEQFKGPEFQKGAAFKGYFKEAETIKHAEASNLYNEARSVAPDVSIPAESILQPIIKDLESSGVAVKILPTKAERTGMRIAGELDPLTEEQRGYTTILDRLTPEQRQAFRAGSAGGHIPAEIYKSLFQDLLPESKSGFVVPSSRSIAGREGEVLQALDTMVLPESLTVNDALNMHQRLNGAIRAAEKSKDFNLSRQFRNYKSAIDNALPPEVKEKLANADMFYAREYVPYFSPGSKLFKINQQKAASIVDSLVSKNDPRLTEKAMGILDDEAKDNLRGAWVQRIFEKSRDEYKNTFDPAKLSKEYKSYLPEVRNAILGPDAKLMDEIVDGFSKRVKELQDTARAKSARARMAAEVAQRAAKEEPKILSQVQKGAKESITGAKGFAKEAAKAFDITADALARQTAQIAKEQIAAATPQMGHILGFSNLQVQAALGLMDVMEFMGGAGGRRYLIFAARHAAVYYLAQHPEMLGKIATGGRSALSIVNRVINGNPLAANYARDARAFFLLAEQAEYRKQQEESQ